MASHIEACPFCGTEHNHISHNMMTFFVVCQRCSSSGPRRRKVDIAIQDWNQLSTSQQQSKHITNKTQHIKVLLSQLNQLEREVKNVLANSKR